MARQMKAGEVCPGVTKRKAETLTEILRRVLHEVDRGGRTNAEAVVQALIDKARDGDVEAIATILDRVVSVKIVIEL